MLGKALKEMGAQMFSGIALAPTKWATGKVSKQLRFEEDLGKFGHWCMIMKRCSLIDRFYPRTCITTANTGVGLIYKRNLKETPGKGWEALVQSQGSAWVQDKLNKQTNLVMAVQKGMSQSRPMDSKGKESGWIDKTSLKERLGRKRQKVRYANVARLCSKVEDLELLIQDMSKCIGTVHLSCNRSHEHSKTSSCFSGKGREQQYVLMIAQFTV